MSDKGLALKTNRQPFIVNVRARRTNRKRAKFVDPLLAISFKSFSSVWYWIMTGIAWSMTCHYTLGVPYDALVRAHSKGGKYAEEAETLARLNINRISDVAGRHAALVTACIGFILAMIATFGFGYGYEIAQAFFVLVAPITLVHLLGARLAVRLRTNAVMGEELRNALTRRRFWNQVIGLSSIFLASMLAFWNFAKDIAFWNL